MATRFIIILLLGSLECVAQNKFAKSTRLALSFDYRGYYDSAQYNLFKWGKSQSNGINLEVQWNLASKLSWNNELQVIKFSPNKKETNILDVAGLATKFKYYLYNNNETYEGSRHLLNPYAQYGFQYTNFKTEPSFQFISMIAAVGTELNLHRLKRGFMQVNYSLGYGSKAINYLGFQFGISYNFEEKIREKKYYKNRETDFRLTKIKLEFEQCKIRAFQDSLESKKSLNYVNDDLIKWHELADSLARKNNNLFAELKSCIEDFKWVKDSLDTTTQILRNIYIKQWQSFEWMQQDSAIKSKNGFFAVALQTYDLKELKQKNENNKLSFPYAIIKNKYNAYRLLYFIGNTMNGVFDDNFSQVLEHFPLAEIVKLEDF